MPPDRLPALPCLAVLQGKQFNVIVTEGRPDETGLTMARVLEELRLPTTVVLDSGVGYIMER
jgi:translation initiation factor eIF-2B subunit alpha